MAKRILFYAYLVLSGTCSSLAYAERIISVKPGLWEYTHNLDIPGLVTPLSKPRSECVSQKEAEQDLADLLGELSSSAGCEITNLKSSLNTVGFSLICKRDIANISLHSSGNMNFRYSREKITGIADGIVSLNGVSIPVQATAMAHHIGRCKD